MNERVGARVSRRLIDVGFACAVLACAVVYATREHIPDRTCDDNGVPRIPARASVAAVFAQIHGPEDVTGWSMTTLERELRGQGFREAAPRVFERADAVVELIAVPDEEAVVEATLNRELGTRDVVYYNGHHFGGDLKLHGSALAILDTCYSTQFYAGQLEMIGNRERAITGSVYGFADLLAALLARDGSSYRALLAPINSAAIVRAAERSQYPEPERYSYCGQGPAVEP